MQATAGERLFARYAYPPNELGYCGPDGPDDSAQLLSAAAGGSGEVRARAKHFAGAWIYLQLIADAGGIDDPLDERVVEAYWIGNELLEAVDPGVFASTVRAAFVGEVGADWRTLQLPARRPRAHHSFQVFAVYPWVRMLDRGDTARRVLDRCRIRTAEVRSVSAEYVDVVSRPLTWRAGRLGLGHGSVERVRWSTQGRVLSGERRLAEGDRVALHMDWMCDRLTAEQAEACDRLTLDQLALTNEVIAARGLDG